MAVNPSNTELTAAIVAAFVSNNTIDPLAIPDLIARISAALRATASLPEPDSSTIGRHTGASSKTIRSPAVAIEDSVTTEYIVCLEDGLRLRSLKRYIKRKYALSPEEYRSRWDLPPDYPMTAPAYTQLRSKIAKEASRRRNALVSAPRLSVGHPP